MRLRRKIPADRTFDQIKRHYEVEKALADRLKRADREERKRIYVTMYDELFTNVPDHPRLTARDDEDDVQKRNALKLRLLEEFIGPEKIVAEFGPGDCNFAYHLCHYVNKVYAIDISDQRCREKIAPENFELIIYDGFKLDMTEELIHIVFSDQFIEHLHPEDVEGHFGLVKRILRKGGIYIFRTPHAFSGPDDISGFFSMAPEGFHLKEWTFSELGKLLRNTGFTHFFGYWRIAGEFKKIPIPYFNIIEPILKLLPYKSKKFISRLFIPRKLIIVAVK